MMYSSCYSMKDKIKIMAMWVRQSVREVEDYGAVDEITACKSTKAILGSTESQDMADMMHDGAWLDDPAYCAYTSPYSSAMNPVASLTRLLACDDMCSAHIQNNTVAAYFSCLDTVGYAGTGGARLAIFVERCLGMLDLCLQVASVESVRARDGRTIIHLLSDASTMSDINTMGLDVP